MIARMSGKHSYPSPAAGDADKYMTLNWTWLAGGAAGAVLVALAAWFVFSAPAENAPGVQTGELGSGDTRGTGTSDQRPAASDQPIVIDQNAKIFKIANGPIAGATLIQTLRPTTTVARYVTADRGHVFDLALDSPGAVPRSVSNTTIPGIRRALWTASGSPQAQRGSGVLLQYLDGEIMKTLALSNFSTSTQSIRIQFLPNNIQDIAVSPDGAQAAYLVRTTTGSEGYAAKSDGSGAKKVFSLPLAQVLLSWPAQNNLLSYSASAAGVPGIAFSVSAGGAVSPILYAPGLTALANRDFSKVLYQTNGGERATYVYDVTTGLSTRLSFDPFPEKCVLSAAAQNRLYCAVPLLYVEPDHLDLWRLGAASAADGIVAYNLSTGRSEIIASPGSGGGVPSDIAELSVSPDDQ